MKLIDGKAPFSLVAVAFGLIIAATPSYALTLTPGLTGGSNVYGAYDMNVNFSSVAPSNCNIGCLDTLQPSIGTVSMVNDLY